MVETLWLVLGGLALYTVVAMALQERGLLPEQVRMQGPITTLHTQYGKKLLDTLAKPKRFWLAWGNFGVGIALVVMVGVFVLVLSAGLQALSNPQPTAVNEPQNVLVIPGVNDFLPLSVAPEIVFGLLVGLVVHEGGHGLFCRVGDIDIESMGLALLAIIPVGAFVEPDEKSRLHADRGSQTRMFAAGVTNNFAITVLAFFFLFGPVAGSIAVAPGVPVGDVVDGSPAAAAGIEYGDRITHVNGEAISDANELDRRLAETPDEQVEVTVEDGDGSRTVTVTRSLFIARSTPSVVEGVDTSGGAPKIESVAGQSVSTRAELYDALAKNPVATVETDEGSFELISGAYIVQVNEDGGLAAAGVPTDAQVVVTRVAGERIVTDADLTRVLSQTSPGETVAVTAYVDGTPKQYDVTLVAGPAEGRGYLGVGVRSGTGGVAVDDFGVFEYPAERFLSVLGGEGASEGIRAFIARIVTSLFLPLAGAVGVTSYNFAGFVDPITNFYTVEGPLGFLGGGVFLLANALFWTGWININLGFFNCVPTYPLDGGHILRTTTEAIVSRLPVSNGRAITRAVTTVVSLSMLGGLLLMVFGPQLLA